MRLVFAAVIAATFAIVPTANADGYETVVSAGPEVGFLEQPGQDLPELHTGYFLRLALTPGIPAYTTAARGYRWRHGLSGELILRGGSTDYNDDKRYTGASVGLRFDIAFSQRRMGLLEVSGRGGFYFAARAGIVRADSFAGPNDVIYSLPNGGGFAQPPPVSQRAGSLVVGTYILLGKRLRIGTELGVLAIGYSRDVDPRVGGLIRVSLGASL